MSVQTQPTERPLMLRPPEAAKLLGVSRALAYRWADQGVIPSIRIGKSVRIPYDALLAWIERHTKEARI